MSRTRFAGPVESCQSIAIQIVVQEGKEHVVFCQIFFVKFGNISVGLDYALSSEKKYFIYGFKMSKEISL